MMTQRNATRAARMGMWLAGLAALAIGAVSSAEAGSIDRFATDVTLAGPAGWLTLCQQQPAVCAPTGTPTVVELDAAQWDWVRQVNRYVNATITPVRDTAGDVWQVGVSEGDCEEFALAKRQALLDAGFPAGAIRLAVAQRQGEYHAVLTLETTMGTMVLDNLIEDIVPFDSLPYGWVLLERTDQYIAWSVLDQSAGTVQTASAP